MKNFLFKAKRDGFGQIPKDTTDKDLHKLYVIYNKLQERADPYNYEFSCTMEELAQFLGYKNWEVKSILKDLAKLNLIIFEINQVDNQLWIKLLVH